MKYLAAIWLVLTIGIGYELTGMAFVKGFEQGYAEGKQRAEITEDQVLQVCTAWWFGEGNPRAMQAINQYCERNKK